MSQDHPDVIMWMGIWAAAVIVTFIAFGLIQ